jgi:hypothetical protein
MKLKICLAGLALAGVMLAPARAESPDDWIKLGTRVHGGFGAFIPAGIASASTRSSGSRWSRAA